MTLITICLCFILIVFRLFAQSMEIQDEIVFLINAIALAYVFFVICKYVWSEIKKQDGQLKQFYEIRKRKVKRDITILVVLYLLIGLIYFSVIHLKEPKWAGCVNDILAIITLGISILDNEIKEYLYKRYRNKK